MISPSNLSLHALPQQSFQAFYKLCSRSSSKVSIWAVHPSTLSKLCPTSLSNLSLQAFHLSSPSNLSVQFLHPSSLSKLSIQALPLRSVQAFSMFCPSSSFNLYFWALSLQALHLNFSTKLSIQGLNKSSLQALSSLRTFFKCSTSLSGKASIRFNRLWRRNTSMDSRKILFDCQLWGSVGILPPDENDFLLDVVYQHDLNFHLKE